jgi:hypothetical protein
MVSLLLLTSLYLFVALGLQLPNSETETMSSGSTKMSFNTVSSESFQQLHISARIHRIVENISGSHLI